MKWFSIVLLCGKIDRIHTNINIYTINSNGYGFVFDVIHLHAIIFFGMLSGVALTWR